MSLKNELKQLNICNDNDIDKMDAYMEEILKWNTKINLTAIVNKDEFIKKHLVDSLAIITEKEFKKSTKIIDIGTGAGFPGIPLAIVSPDKQFVLMDSLNKRLRVIDELCEKIGIQNVKTVHARAEELGHNQEYREKFDLVLSRAVASLPTLVEYCLPFVKLNGYFVAYKGPNAKEEIDNSNKGIKILGGKLDKIRESISNNITTEHNLIFIKKMEKTPNAYPRKSGKPTKEPII